MRSGYASCRQAPTPRVWPRPLKDLHAYLEQHRPPMVLIAGSVAHVPAGSFTAKKLGRTCETDQTYGLPDPTTGLPALQVGRIPARNEAELKAVLAKVIRYETRFVPGEARNTVLFLASPAHFGKTVDTVIEHVATRMLSRELDQCYHLNVIYSSPGSAFFLPPRELPARTRSAFEAGPLLAVFAGHGQDRGFARVWHRNVTPYFEVQHTRGMRCRDHYPLFFSITCLTGDFEQADRPGLCASLALEPGGPVATFGSSEVSQPVPNLLLQKAILNQVANAQPATLGQALAAVRLDFRDRTEPLGRLVDRFMRGDQDDAAHKQHTQHLYNLFGDPATRLGFPAHDLKLSVAVEGDQLVLTGSSPSVRQGTALVRYDIDRKKLKDRIKPHKKLPEDQAAAVISENHRTAADKTLFKQEVPIQDGRFSLALDRKAATPRRVNGRLQWTFYFRVYAWNDHQDAVGSIAYEPEEEKPSRD